MPFPLAEGSLLYPLRPLRLKHLHENEFDVLGKKSVTHLDSSSGPPINLESGQASVMLLKYSVLNGVVELQCLVEQKARRIYLEEENFNSIFCAYPSHLLNRGEELTPEEEWLTRYFGVKGKLFYSNYHHRPQVVYEDYQEMKQNHFIKLTVRASGEKVMTGIRTEKRTSGLGKTECVVVGHAIRIRPGNRKLVFEFFSPEKGRTAFWEFNERHTPKKLAKCFTDHWRSYYVPVGEEYRQTLYMKRLD